jgi:hypothetical protein
MESQTLKKSEERKKKKKKKKIGGINAYRLLTAQRNDVFVENIHLPSEHARNTPFFLSCLKHNKNNMCYFQTHRISTKSTARAFTRAREKEKTKKLRKKKTKKKKKTQTRNTKCLRCL